MAVIEIRHLRKAYGKPVLNGVNLIVEAGTILGYLGPNGAGKSTTIKILTGMIPDFDGEVSVLGWDIRTHPMEVKRRIGYVPEQGALYEVLTPMEYLVFIGQLYGMAAPDIESKAEALLHIFGLQDVRKKRMNSFSKGMKQKVLIIAGLLHNPDLIFLDEPLNGLDANAVLLMKQILAQLAQEGKTIFYSSHLMDVVEKISHRIVILDYGRVVADGTFEDLRKKSHHGSLEDIFKGLTNTRQTETEASHFMDILKWS